MNASCLEINDEEHEIPYEASAREHLDAEEVRRRDGAPVRLEEGLPGHRLSTEWSGLDTVRLEDALDGGPSDVQAQLLEGVARRV